MKRLVLVLALVAMFVLLGGSALAQGSWRLQTIDSDEEESIRGVSIAVDSTGNPHVSYTTQLMCPHAETSTLKYARWDGSRWRIEVVGSLSGDSTSIVLDSADRPHIAYVGGSYSGWTGPNQRLEYASWNGSSWTIKTVDSDGDAFWAPSITLDSAGQPHISYSSNGRLKYARWDGANWHVETATRATDVGNCTCIELDSAGNPHIFFTDQFSKRYTYVYQEGTAWKTATSGSGGYGALALDSAELPHISYHSSTSIRYISLDESFWITDTVDSTGGGVSSNSCLVMDSADRPHILYQGRAQSINYAHWDGSDWQGETVASAEPFGIDSISLALDPTDRPHIVYSDFDKLMYAVYR